MEKNCHENHCRPCPGNSRAGIEVRDFIGSEDASERPAGAQGGTEREDAEETDMLRDRRSCRARLSLSGGGLPNG